MSINDTACKKILILSTSEVKLHLLTTSSPQVRGNDAETDEQDVVLTCSSSLVVLVVSPLFLKEISRQMRPHVRALGHPRRGIREFGHEHHIQLLRIRFRNHS
jgi:hypothetical protein